MENCDEKDVGDVPQEPGVDIFEVGGAGEMVLKGGKEGRQNKEGSHRQHKAVTELIYANEQTGIKVQFSIKGSFQC